MKYEEPCMQILLYNSENIITTSTDDEDWTLDY